ncbi:MAG: DUF1320 domain-containing protein [Gallionella sp.]|nr:DUF1320 domain-containing protein [Gallionella sp.]
MAYVTTAQLISEFGESALIALTDKSRQGVIDQVALDRAVASAEATVNGYVGGRYTLPLLPVTEDVVGAMFAIVRYILDGENGNEAVAKRHAAAIVWLKDVSAGRAVLSGVAALAPVAPASSRIDIRSQPSVFGRGVR